jgi:hypothetical protein
MVELRKALIASSSGLNLVLLWLYLPSACGAYLCLIMVVKSGHAFAADLGSQWHWSACGCWPESLHVNALMPRTLG